MNGTHTCDWCDVRATSLRVWQSGPPAHICADCFARQGVAGVFINLPLSNRKPTPTFEQLWDFVEEIRDHSPDVYSGRASDPQDDVNDMIDAEVLWDFQKDAEKLIGKRQKRSAA